MSILLLFIPVFYSIFVSPYFPFFIHHPPQFYHSYFLHPPRFLKYSRKNSNFNGFSSFFKHFSQKTRDSRVDSDDDVDRPAYERTISGDSVQIPRILERQVTVGFSL